MASWIKLEITTPDKPEVYRMAEALAIAPEHVLGALIRVWIWADQQTENGNAGCVTRFLVDRVSGVSQFADAMVSVGWLVDQNGGLTFPNFDRHNGETAKKRAQNAQRQAKFKGNAKVTHGALRPRYQEKEKEYNTPLSPPKGAGLPAADEKSRRPNTPAKPTEPTPPNCLTAHLQDAAFTTAWYAWLKHGKAKRRRTTPEALQEHAALVAALPVAEAVRALKHAIAQDLPAPTLPRSMKGTPTTAAAAPRTCPRCDGTKMVHAVLLGERPIDTAAPDQWPHALTVRAVRCACQGNNDMAAANGFKTAAAAREFVAACVKRGTPA